MNAKGGTNFQSNAKPWGKSRGWVIQPAAPAPAPWWPLLTLLWVCVQGLFGALTVTMKLFPAIVTLHLLGGLGLLALLAIQSQLPLRSTLQLPPALRWGAAAVLVLVIVQGLPAGQQAVIVAFAAMPTASAAYILANRMGGDGAYVAKLITVSLLVSMFALPFWLSMM